MARRNRETLKNYFRQGKRPSEQEFTDLIDSTLNTLDDGYSGSPQTGLGLTPLTEKGTILSAFRNQEDTKPIWEIAVDKNNADLHIRRCGGDESTPLITVKYEDSTISGTPEIAFNGIINCKGRKGSFKNGVAPADGNWHDIINSEDRLEAGCWAFEIVAYCGQRHKGRYALAVATAINCFGANAKIHTVQSHFGQWGNKIKLRWKKVKGEHNAKLQIKTYFRYSNEAQIEYQISALWSK